MLECFRTIANRRKDETGASAVEYGLLVALVVAVIVVAVFALSTLINSTFEDTGDAIEGEPAEDAAGAHAAVAIF